MSKYFWLCKVNTQKHVDGRPMRFKDKIKCSPLALNILFIVVIVLLGTAYLVQINQTATSGFAMKDMNKQINELKEQHQKLELQVADLQSLQNIQDATERLQLVSHTKLEYVQPTDGMVALEKIVRQSK